MLKLSWVEHEKKFYNLGAWSHSSLGTFWKAKDAKFLDADNEDSDRTAQADFRLRWTQTFSHVAKLFTLLKRCL